MIYVNFTGRCGNQMFQYAFARKLSLLNDDLKFVFNFYNVHRVGKDLDKFQSTFIDELRNFSVLDYSSIDDKNNIVDSFGSKRQQRIRRRYLFFRKISFKFKAKFILSRYQKYMRKHGIFYEDECKCSPCKVHEKNIFLKGYFENPSYFRDIREILAKEFTPKAPPLSKNNNLLKFISENESVCVTIRVWDELETKKDTLLERDICHEDYYLQAMDIMKKMSPNCKFIIFSNNVSWVREHYRFNYDVEYEDGDDEACEKMRLMSACKHFIISPSTFSWWAQYLSLNPQKIVISPKKWTLSNKKKSFD